MTGFLFAILLTVIVVGIVLVSRGGLGRMLLISILLLAVSWEIWQYERSLVTTLLGEGDICGGQRQSFPIFLEGRYESLFVRSAQPGITRPKPDHSYPTRELKVSVYLRHVKNQEAFLRAQGTLGQRWKEEISSYYGGKVAIGPSHKWVLRNTGPELSVTGVPSGEYQLEIAGEWGHCVPFRYGITRASVEFQAMLLTAAVVAAIFGVMLGMVAIAEVVGMLRRRRGLPPRYRPRL